ncbi:ras guanine nucleotide exchange factor domain-containing protein [Schizophyllum fasciatum]
MDDPSPNLTTGPRTLHRTQASRALKSTTKVAFPATDQSSMLPPTIRPPKLPSPKYRLPHDRAQPPPITVYPFSYLKASTMDGIWGNMSSERAAVHGIDGRTVDREWIRDRILTFRDLAEVMLQVARTKFECIERDWSVEETALNHAIELVLAAGFGPQELSIIDMQTMTAVAMDDAIEIAGLYIRARNPAFPVSITRPNVERIINYLRGDPNAYTKGPMHPLSCEQARSMSIGTASRQPTLSTSSASSTLVSTASSNTSSSGRSRSSSLKEFMRNRAFSVSHTASSSGATSLRSRASSQSSQLRSPASRATAEAHRERAAEIHTFAHDSPGVAAINDCFIPGICSMAPMAVLDVDSPVKIIWSKDEDDNPLPRAASLPGLVELLATSYGAQTELIRVAIIVSFRYYCTPKAFLRLVHKRWNAKGITPAQRIPEHIHLITFLILWLRSYWRWEDDQEALHRIKKFYYFDIRRATEVPQSLRTELVRAIERVNAVNWNRAERLPRSLDLHPVPGSGFSVARDTKILMAVHRLQKGFPQEVGQQLMRISSEKFRDIDPLDWYQYAASRSAMHGHALRSFLAHQNGVHIWVVEDILSQTAPMDRALAIEFWITIADYCLSQGDFCTMNSITNALQRSSVRNMRVSFLLVQYKLKLALRALQELQDPPAGAGVTTLIDGTRVADRLVEAVEAKGAPAVPDVGFLLTAANHLIERPENKLTYMSEGTSLVNLRFATHLRNFAARIDNYRVPFRFQARTQTGVQTFIHEMLGQYAPVCTTDADIERYLEGVCQKHAIKEPKRYTCSKQVITLKPGEGIDYCLVGKMKVIPTKDYDGTPIALKKLWSWIDMSER